MFEDHWYQHSPTAEDTSRSSTPQQSSKRASTQNLLVDERKTKPVPRKSKKSPPKAQLRPRATSFGSVLQTLGPTRRCTIDPDTRTEDDQNSSIETELHGQFCGDLGISLAKAKHGWKRYPEIDTISELVHYDSWMEDARIDVYGGRLDEVKNVLHGYIDACDTLLSETDLALQILETLKSDFSAVHAQTSGFQSQCDNLVGEELRLKRLQEDIARGLWPFGQLENIVRKLHKPGTEFVRTKGFLEMLDILDQCLEFCNRYPDFRDTATYIAKFRQSMTRALTLIRVYFVTTIKDIAAEVDKKLAGRSATDAAKTSLIYSKFRVDALELKQLTSEIFRRCSHEEYKSLLGECYSPYITIRQRFVLPLITKRVNEISAGSSDILMLVRSGISYLKTICLDEWDLWHSFFDGGDAECILFLQNLFSPLQGILGPRLYKETDLRKLCELCTLFQPKAAPDDDEYLPVKEHNIFDFSLLTQTVLAETQKRIVERVKIMIREEVQGFQPQPIDLDYPSILLRHAGAPKTPITPSMPMPSLPTVIDKDDISMMDGNEGGFESSNKAFWGWYPTLRKSVWLLSRIYKLVNPDLYGNLAHQIVHTCTQSLFAASKRISDEVSLPDGQLFLIKHLLILKEQIVAFDIEYVQPTEVASQSLSSTLTGTFWAIYENRSLFSRDGLVKLVQGGLPGSVENMVDAKVELDARLREVINEFTSYYAQLMTDFIQDSASAIASKQALDPTRSVIDLVEKHLPLLRRKLSEYLTDQRVREALIGGVQDQVIDNYESFFARISSSSHRAVSLDKVWDVKTFVEWAHESFRNQQADYFGGSSSRPMTPGALSPRPTF